MSQGNFEISITDFIGFFTKQMIFYAMANLQRTVLVCYRYKNSLHLILIVSILYGTHFSNICTSDVPRSTSYGVYISQLIRFAKASSYVADFNTRNKLLTQKLLKQGYRYHKLRKTFCKFYRRYYDLISKFQVGLKSLLRQGLSEPDFYGDLVYKLKKIVGSNNFSAQFIKIISHYKKIGYNINVLQQTACLVVNPITVGNFAFLFNCTPVGRTSDSMMVLT